MIARLKTPEQLHLETFFAELFQVENLKEYITVVEEFAIKAFKNKNGTNWRKLQFMVFEMNLRLMQNGYGLGTQRSLREWILRDTIERIEKQYQPNELLPEYLNNVENFMPWLKERISSHRVNHHPLFVLFDNDNLSHEELRYFLANYRVNIITHKLS
ncbi:MAG: hypothetical protein JGK30_01970 [Microcoleus sp. PH2017_40_RAT_O_B]|uniref:hypothetical protein n=1 Tax=unclassified Microcoleus TaxID=2642155 RepID=UPI001D66662C|nr:MULTISPECIES: hypothetical protein [unclassified Microcoleus]MCC3570721.1 hypothetical protein [Microcoleus sp. PH2017_34_RAT_O_A]MCC3608297.1 hypothetical protein [Microcoleus sp. PH2017_40_RAT_O_B]